MSGDHNMYQKDIKPKKNTRETISFLNCFSTFEEADHFASHLIEPSIIIHTYAYEELQLFAVCTGDALKMIRNALIEQRKK